MMHRRLFLLATAAVLVPAAALAAKPQPKAKPKPVAKPAAKPAAPQVLPVLPADPAGMPDAMMGDPKAPVTLVEYGSVACPYCAHFNETVFPEIKAKYIDTGKVRYVYRPMITGVQSIAMTGHRLAECAGKDRYFEVIDTVMRAQHEMYAMGENDIMARPILGRIGASFGFDDKAFAACVTEPTAYKALRTRDAKYLDAGIRGTPAFFINGQRFEYKDGGIAEFDAAFAALH